MAEATGRVNVRSAPSRPLDERARVGWYASATLAVWVGIGLGAIVPLLVIARGPITLASALTAAVTFWAGWRLAQLIYHGKALLYDFTFWLYVYVFLGLSATAQAALHVFPDTLPGVGVEFLEQAAVMSIVGIASWEVGRLIADRRGTHAQALRAARVPDGTRANLLLFAGLPLAGYYIAKVGPGSLLSSRETMSAAQAAAWPNSTIGVIAGAASFTPLLVGIHASTQHRRQQRLLGLKPAVNWLLLVSVPVLLFVANPIGNARIQAGTVLLSFLPLLGFFSTPARARATMLAIMGVFILLFPYADYFRQNTTSLTVTSPVEQFANKGDYDSFPQIANTVEHVARFGHTDGMQALGTALFWVPRTSWSGKPLDTGVMVAQQKGYQFTNVSSPLWAEAFIDGGWIAVVVVFVAVGYLMRRASLRAVAELPTCGIGGISAAILSFYMLIILRGSLLQAMCVFVAILACLRFVRQKVPAAQADLVPQRGPPRVKDPSCHLGEPQGQQPRVVGESVSRIAAVAGHVQGRAVARRSGATRRSAPARP